MPIAADRDGRSAAEVHAAIERFLKTSRQPAVLEPGEKILPLADGNFVLELRGSRLTLQAWDRERNLVRRIVGVKSAARGKLELIVERFARREGSLYLVDLAHPAGMDLERRGPRRVLRERFREMLSRQFAGWKIAELTVEADLQHSLSPAYPRALLKQGQSGWAAIAAEADPASAAGVLSSGLIWLDYLRTREPRLTIEGLALFVPVGSERTTCLRVPFLNDKVAAYNVFAYSDQGYVVRLDPRDHGNLDTRLERCRRPPGGAPATGLEDVEQIPRPDGSVSLRLRGIEFARWSGGEVRFAPKGRQLAQDLAQFRSPAAADRDHPLYRQHPEAWLESQVRTQIRQIDASLQPEPVYSHVPAFAGGDRDVLDLVAVDYAGRLAVLELKASADLRLPLQALDYWIRVKWHLDRGEFTSLGYFPDVALRAEAPRLLLVSPALEFHPTTEAILRYFSHEVDVERIGVGLEWRKRLEIMFRLRGHERP